MNNKKDIKPFYIYTDKNSLYIRNINEQNEKLANNIYAYSANIDDDNNIHICGLDTRGKLTHFFNKNGIWKKVVISKVFKNIKNIKDLRLYIIDNLFNIFIVEKYPISENLYKISHFNFNANDYKIYRYTINNIYKDNEHIYKLNIDELSNIIFEYKLLNTTSRDFNDTTLVFNSASRKWLDINFMTRNSNNIKTNIKPQLNIKDDIFEYCYSIKYKF